MAETTPFGLKKISSPELTSAEYGKHIRERFQDIDDNFKKVSTIDLVRGATGDSAILERFNLDAKTVTGIDGNPVPNLDSEGHSYIYWINRIKHAILKHFGIVDYEFDQIKNPETVIYDECGDTSDAIDADGQRIHPRAASVDCILRANQSLLTEEELTDIKPANAYNVDRAGLWSLFGESYAALETSKEYPIIVQGGSITFINQVHNETPSHISSMAYVYHDPRFTVPLGQVNASDYLDAEDFSCVLYWVTDENGQNGRFEVVQAFPTLYYDEDLGTFCWVFNGQRTGLPARGPAGLDGASGNMWIVMTDPNTIDGLEGTRVENIYQVQRFMGGNLDEVNDWKKFEYSNTNPIYRGCEGSPCIVFQVDPIKFYQLNGLYYGELWVNEKGDKVKCEYLDQTLIRAACSKAGITPDENLINQMEKYKDWFLYYSNATNRNGERLYVDVPSKNCYWLSTLSKYQTEAKYTNPEIPQTAGEPVEVMAVMLTDGNKVSQDVDWETLLKLIREQMSGASLLQIPLTDWFYERNAEGEINLDDEGVIVQELHTQFANEISLNIKDTTKVVTGEHKNLRTPRIDDNLVSAPVLTITNIDSEGIKLKCNPSFVLGVNGTGDNIDEVVMELVAINYTDFRNPEFTWKGGSYTATSTRPIPGADDTKVTSSNGAVDKWCVLSFNPNFDFENISRTFEEKYKGEDLSYPEHRINEKATRMFSVIYSMWVQGTLASDTGIFERLNAKEANFSSITINEVPIGDTFDKNEFIPNRAIREAAEAGMREISNDRDDWDTSPLI